MSRTRQHRTAMRPSRNSRILLSVLILGSSIRSVIVSIRALYIDELRFSNSSRSTDCIFGNGVVPWEYDYGIRSWLLPSFNAVKS